MAAAAAAAAAPAAVPAELAAWHAATEEARREARLEAETARLAADHAAMPPGSRTWSAASLLRAIVDVVEKFDAYTASMAEALRTFGTEYSGWSSVLMDQLRQIRFPPTPREQIAYNSHAGIVTRLLRFKYNLDGDNNVAVTRALLDLYVVEKDVQAVVQTLPWAEDPSITFTMDKPKIVIVQYWMRRARNDVMRALLQTAEAQLRDPMDAEMPVRRRFRKAILAAQISDLEQTWLNRRMQIAPTRNVVALLQQRETLGRPALTHQDLFRFRVHRRDTHDSYSRQRDDLEQLVKMLPGMPQMQIVIAMDKILKKMGQNGVYMRTSSAYDALLVLKRMVQVHPLLSHQTIGEELSAIVRGIPHPI